MFKFVSATLALVAGALSLNAQAHGPGRPGRSHEDPAVVTQWNTIAEANTPASTGVLRLNVVLPPVISSRMR